jgi:hypothetical protein
MAYVAISGELIDRVKHKTQEMSRKELKTIGDVPNTGFNPNSKFIEDMTWKEHVHLKSILPEEFTKQLSRVDVLFLHNGRKQRTHLDFLVIGNFPPKLETYYPFEPDWEAPELSTLRAWFISKTEMEIRWSETEEKIVNFLRSCKSLNEAVKLWPDVALYVMESDIERMGVKREKVKESKALEALKELDTDALVSNVVIARMSGA